MTKGLIEKARGTDIEEIKRKLESFGKDFTPENITKINDRWLDIMYDRNQFSMIFGSCKEYSDPPSEYQDRIRYYCCLEVLRESEEVSIN